MSLRKIFNIDFFSAISFQKFNLNLVAKILITFSVILICGISLSEAAEKKGKKEDETKKCIYCKKYEKIIDWPEKERPEAYIWEEVKYPDGMFHKSKNTPKKIQGAAGQKVYKRFVKSKKTLNKYQHLMIRDMAYFEALFNEMLKDKKAKVETLEGLKKGRDAMRMSLQISPKAKTSEAVLKFWATGKMLKIAYNKNKKKKKKNSNIDPEIAERAAVLANIKKQLATAKVNAQRAATIEAQKKIEEAN
tara:strand:+ start:542 stop:1285 length:744 start_codon:yes stop_codon:yes gene_type:complete